MARFAISILGILMAHSVSASTIFKCIKDDKIVFSQIVCPNEFKQHTIEYQLGVTTETDSDKVATKQDPLHTILNDKTISREKLLMLIKGEISRLHQENSYHEVLRSSELQKLERKRYWQEKEKNDPEHIKGIKKINEHFNSMNAINDTTIKVLSERYQQIE
ncbi:DUF4124 domain-containing protein [Parashewanella spongiae]|uniref:DUF4124 domain-containing protein n=1 Tax=Parashewanella spongiae TaxID=342950 RepID=A0A3A6UIP5_9GAMM|nr:DUF4124 domain-containing protein [Parashewanella spongiae]MCL1079665.1 DUF4124 domain-containing protein [Parashewanella spongiae]RJY18963.1 DUF4124 domain-containing protein [Parashewanella spongiae]